MQAGPEALSPEQQDYYSGAPAPGELHRDYSALQGVYRVSLDPESCTFRKIASSLVIIWDSLSIWPIRKFLDSNSNGGVRCWRNEKVTLTSQR